MAEPENAPASGDAAPLPFWEARQLLRAARAGTLATSAAGQPFASLVTPACAPDLSILMLLSSLSEHTRHLRADPRCAIMVTGTATSANPQTAPRVTVTGLAEADPDPELKARWLAIHPYAAFYADFGDFALWRVRPMAALLVGGFARAARVKQADLLPDPAAVAAVREAEPRIIAHCNADHADAMDKIASTAGASTAGASTAGASTAGGSGAGWRMVTADVDGCDLWREEQVVRAHWSAPVASGEDVRRETIRLTRAGQAVA